MKIYKNLALLLVSSLTLGSCSSDLLDIPQQGVLSEDGFYQTDDDAESALAAVANLWRMTYSGANTAGGDYYCNGIWFKNMMADELQTGGERIDDVQYQICEKAIKPTNQWVEIYYKNLYSTIYRANLVIEKFGEGASATMKRCAAEARVFRALCNFELVTLWGTAPIVDHVLATDEFEVGNSTSEDMWAFIEKDLNDAINSGNMLSKSNPEDGETNTHMTKEGAESLLGKVYLYQNKYTQAKEQLGNVINSGLYGLIDDYADLWHVSAGGSKEYVMEIVRHYDKDNKSQDGWWNMLCNWEFNYALAAGPEANDHYHFCTEGGWGSFNPSKKLYDDFVKEEGEDGYRLSKTIVPYDKVASYNVYFYTNYYCYGHEGYFRLKWLANTDADDFNYWYFGQYANTPVIRYADVLLMMAEASLNTGDTGTALTCLNQVRERVNLAPKTMITMDDIKTERELELSMEGLRFQDLKRWGDAPTVLADWGKSLPSMTIYPEDSNDYSTAQGIYNAKYRISVKYVDNERADAGYTIGRDEYLPFPETELEANPNLKQNPGY